jgi:hypothetical protein
LQGLGLGFIYNFLARVIYNGVLRFDAAHLLALKTTCPQRPAAGGQRPQGDKNPLGISIDALAPLMHDARWLPPPPS